MTLLCFRFISFGLGPDKIEIIAHSCRFVEGVKGNNMSCRLIGSHESCRIVLATYEDPDWQRECACYSLGFPVNSAYLS